MTHHLNTANTADAIEVHLTEALAPARKIDDIAETTPSPVTETITNEFMAACGQLPRDIDSEEIVERLLYPMINEGALILEEKMAQRASDIDLVWTHGYGWPRATGGPMLWADRIGLATVVQGLEKHRDRLGDDFTLSPLLQSLARDNQNFHSKQPVLQVS